MARWHLHANLAWRALDSHAPPNIDASSASMCTSLLVLGSNLYICAFSFEVTVTSVENPPSVSHRGLLSKNQRLSLCSCSVWCGAEVFVTSQCKEVAMSSHQR